MPIGITINICSVFFGGIFGVLIGKYIPTRIKNELTLLFGLSSIAIGIPSIVGMQNMPVVVMSIIIGTVIGMLLHVSDYVQKGAKVLEKLISKVFKNQSELNETEYMQTLVMIIVLFCASGTGIYGSLVEGMSGDPTILISKSILDFFTAAIFASQLGMVVSAIAIPQGIVFLSLFALSGVIMPYVAASMFADFKACGGLLVIATGLRMMKIKDFPLADMVVSMVLVIPLSWLWVSYILPLIV